MDDDELRVQCLMAAATMWANSSLVPNTGTVLDTAKRFYEWCIEEDDE